MFIAPRYVLKEFSDDRRSIINESVEYDNANILNDINEMVVEPPDIDMEENINIDKGPLTSNSDISNIGNDISPTSPEGKNYIENINERISRIIDQNEDRKIELYNSARIKGKLNFFKTLHIYIYN